MGGACLSSSPERVLTAPLLPSLILLGPLDLALPGLYIANIPYSLSCGPAGVFFSYGPPWLPRKVWAFFLPCLLSLASSVNLKLS
jgi:hypothetical protein